MTKANANAGKEVCQGPFPVLVTEVNNPRVTTSKKAEAGKPGEPLTIRTHVEDPSSVKSVWACFRSFNQKQDPATIQMLAPGSNHEYSARIPGCYLDSCWSSVYLIDAFDIDGKGVIFPDLNKEAPYFVVLLRRGSKMGGIIQEIGRSILGGMELFNADRLETGEKENTWVHRTMLVSAGASF